MKTIAVVTLVISSAVTGVYQHNQERAALAALQKSALDTWKTYNLQLERDYYKALAEDMVREVDCLPLVGPGTRHGPRHNDPKYPDMEIHNPDRVWFS